MQDISFTIHIFKEGDTYVAYASELDVSNCGSTGIKPVHYQTLVELLECA